MKFTFIITGLLCLIGCNNGRPIVSPRLDVEISQDFVLGFTKYSHKVENFKSVTNQRNGSVPSIDIFSGNWESILIPLAIMVIVSGVNEVNSVSEHESKVGFNRNVLVKIGNTGKEYDFNYGLNRFKMSDADIELIKNEGVTMAFNVNGVLYGNKLVKLPPIRNPKSCKVLLAADGLVYIDGFVAE